MTGSHKRCKHSLLQLKQGVRLRQGKVENKRPTFIVWQCTRLHGLVWVDRGRLFAAFRTRRAACVRLVAFITCQSFLQLCAYLHTVARSRFCGEGRKRIVVVYVQTSAWSCSPFRSHSFNSTQLLQALPPQRSSSRCSGAQKPATRIDVTRHKFPLPPLRVPLGTS